MIRVRRSGYHQAGSARSVGGGTVRSTFGPMNNRSPLTRRAQNRGSENASQPFGYRGLAQSLASLRVVPQATADRCIRRVRG
jgi:hypothetical protein